MSSENADYDAIIRPIEQRMMRSIWRLLHDPDEAKDAFQDAMETIWRKWPRIRSHPNPQALVLRICTHTAIDRLRRIARRRRHEQVHQDQDLLPDPSPNIADRLAGLDLYDQVISALGQLPRNQAEAMTMRFIQGLSYEAIAQAIGCAESTVRTHIVRGRAKIIHLLDQLSPSSEQGGR